MFLKLLLVVVVHWISSHCVLGLVAEEHALELVAAAEVLIIFVPVVLKIQESSLLVISFHAQLPTYVNIHLI